MASINPFAKFRTFLFALALAAASGVSLGVKDAAAAVPGNCSPGFSTCWFAAECTTRCKSFTCTSATCHDSGSLDCYACVPMDEE